MSNWQPDQYLLFEDERTRPCRDLADQIHLKSSAVIIDLGCGPGNSTEVLAQRWPTASITGLDSSLDMLRRARSRNPQQELIHSDIGEWAEKGGEQYDLVFSNAAMQWVLDHATVYPRLLDRVAHGGALAIQVPSNLHEPAHQIMRDVASSAGWRDTFPAHGVKEWFVHDAPFYYDLVAPLARSVTMWETTYFHVLPGLDAITEWYRSTGLRPFLAALSGEEDRQKFLRDYTAALASSYKLRPDGKVLFPFRRLFLIARK